jgi:hypothetical protein
MISKRMLAILCIVAVIAVGCGGGGGPPADVQCASQGGDWNGLCCIDQVNPGYTFPPCAYDTGSSSFCGKNESGSWKWASVAPAGKVYHYPDCIAEGMLLSNGTAFYQCGGTPISGVNPFPSEGVMPIKGPPEAYILVEEPIPSLPQAGTYCRLFNSPYQYGNDLPTGTIVVPGATTTITQSTAGGQPTTLTTEVVDGLLQYAWAPSGCYPDGSWTCYARNDHCTSSMGKVWRTVSVVHDYYCNDSAITECRGGQLPLSSDETSDATGVARTVNVTNKVYYCAADGNYTTDLDSKNVTSCAAAGFTWTGTKCCSEADDPDETYEDPGSIGACWNKTFQQNGAFLLNQTLITVNGTMQGCGAYCGKPSLQLLRDYTGDNTPADASGNGPSLKNTFGVSIPPRKPIAYGPGKVNQAFVLDGASVLAMPLSSDFSFGSNVSFTVSLWMKPRAEGASNTHLETLFDTYQVNYNERVTLNYYPDGELFLYFINQFDGFGSASVSLQNATNYGPAFWQDKWHQVAIVRSGNTMKLYVDGEVLAPSSIATYPSIGNMRFNAGTLTLGASQDTSGSPGDVNDISYNHFNGSIDEVKILRYALSDAEMRALYSSTGSNETCDVAAPVTINGLPRPNPVCTVLPHAHPQGDVFCAKAGQWKVDTRNSNRNILKTIAWGTPDAGTTASECCSATSCWTGSACQDNQLGTAVPLNYHGYRCENGTWQYRVPVYNWDRSKSGYCPTVTDCIVQPDGSSVNNYLPNQYYENVLHPQCLADGQYIVDEDQKSDHICEAGTWSTRTKEIGLRLLKLADAVSPTNYQLFCGPASETLNLPAQISAFTGDNTCHAGIRSFPCANNFCVLTTPQGVAWGVSLNKPVNDPSKSFLLALNKSVTFCDNALSGGFNECSSPSGIWYDSVTQTVLSVPFAAGGLSIQSGSASGNISTAELFNQFIESPFDQLKQFVFTRLHNPAGGNDWSFFNNTNTFGRMYAARKDSSRIFAFLEENVFDDQKIKRDYIGMQYTNVDLGANPCLDLILKYDNLASCNATAGNLQIVRQKPLGDVSKRPLLQAWRDLTAKLRPGG